MHKLPRKSRLMKPTKTAPQLRFTPWAWAKLLYLRDAGPTEVGGFGITETFDRALVTDIALVAQTCTSITVNFNDAAVADFFDNQVDQGLRPEQFARIWVHTHPGDCPHPSGTDEDTFSRVFGACDWALMFILAKGGQSYARLRFNSGPGGEIWLAVEVDYGQPFPAANQAEWQAEYDRCVREQRDFLCMGPCDLFQLEPLQDGHPNKREAEHLFEEVPLGGWNEY